jgi:hypothetical protein
MGPNPGGASLGLGATLAEQGQRRVTGRLQPDGSAYPDDGFEEGGCRASEWVADEGRLASAAHRRRKGHEHPAAGTAQAGGCPFCSPHKDAAGPRPLVAAAARAPPVALAALLAWPTDAQMHSR